jgi:L-seryl-tRNA(Ser) seleniumtransferase
MAPDSFRALPAVSRLLAQPRAEHLLVRFNREYVVQACRDILHELRRGMSSGHVDMAAVQEDAILDQLEVRLAGAEEPVLQRVVNAPVTVLHTNLGRALLPEAAVNAVVQAATQPVNLEYDLAHGDRGQREQTIESLLMDLCGAEAATVVNNNAAAVLLALNTIACAKEVIVSRGELIEIGGAFRISEIMARSGGMLKEVGTTNRTHPSDYENAITDQTALLLKVHTSNYRVVGFVAEVGLSELVAIGRTRGIPIMEDLGSGALFDLSRHGLPKEPTPRYGWSRTVAVEVFTTRFKKRTCSE